MSFISLVNCPIQNYSYPNLFAILYQFLSQIISFVGGNQIIHLIHMCLFFPISVKITNLYCFNYNPRTEDLQKSAGWNYYNLESEFKRMHVPNERWHLTIINDKYDLCDTYPKQIYVPVEASTSVLMASSKFRSKGRLPALTYLHPNKASICRCSQPLSGFSARCDEDEIMLETIRKTNPEPNFMYVVDTRPKVYSLIILICTIKLALSHKNPHT